VGETEAVTMPRVSAVPRRTRLVCVVMAVLLVAVFTAIGVLLKQSEAGTTFHTSDQVAMIGMGVLLAAGVLLFTRPRVDADAERIVVRNIAQTHTLRWEVVEGITFADGAPWPTLQLHDDETISVLAIQAVDKQRAVDAVEGLRSLLRAHQGQQATGGR